MGILRQLAQTVTAILVIAVLGCAGGCNTIQGMGEDISALGDSLDDAEDDAESE